MTTGLETGGKNWGLIIAKVYEQENLELESLFSIKSLRARKLGIEITVFHQKFTLW